MALRLTQPLTEMSTRYISLGVGGGKRRPVPRADNLTTSKSGSLKLLELSGPVQTCTGIVYIVLYR